MNTTCLLVNPVAGRGRAKERLSQIIASFARIGASWVRETRSAGDEERITLAAMDTGCTVVAVVGGDGTCARVANTILRAGGTCALAVVPCGTGNDFAKTLGVAELDADRVAALCAGSSPARLDVGAADGHYFLNSCGFGFDPAVLAASNRVRFLKGDAVYIYSAIRQLFTYKGIHVSAVGATADWTGRMLMVTVSNGRWLGGAFRIAPSASALDGKLDACFISDSNIVSRVKVFAGAMRGRHLSMASVSAAGVQDLTLTFADPPAMEMDGELRRATSRTVRIECVPKALAVIAAPGAPL